jgi:hypothetical protein
MNENTDLETVPLVETSLRPSSELKTDRVRQFNALNWPEVKKNLDPEVVTTIPFQVPESIDNTSSNIAVINVISPYTKEDHVMLMDYTPRYASTPREIPDSEGEEMRAVSAKVVAFQAQSAGVDRLSWGYNCSPLNFGKEEEVTGMQSLPTKWHPQIWSSTLKDSPKIALNDDRVAKFAQDFIRGDVFNKIVGEEIARMVAQGTIKKFIDPSSIRVDNQGFHIGLADGLEKLLETSGFFSQFIKPLHLELEGLMAATSTALTDVDYFKLKDQIKMVFETQGDNKAMYQKLQEDPKLLPFNQRLEKIAAMRELGYGDSFIEKLMTLNRLAQDRSISSEADWIRKGFGYALVINQDLGAPQASLHIRPATLIRTSRGGVAETGNVALRRSESRNDTDQWLRNHNIQRVDALKKYLQP